MKKFLLIALTVALVVAFAAPSMAKESQFSFWGNFYMWGYSLSNAGGIKVDDDHNTTYNFMWMKAKLQFRAAVSKTLFFNGTFTGLDKMWGRNIRYYGGEYAVYETYSTPKYKNNEALWREAYITWISPVGYFKLGQYRTDPDPILGKLGTSPVSADRYWNQNDNDVARLIYAGTFVKWHRLILLYEKVYELDSQLAGTVDGSWDYDHDYDVYYMRNDFMWKGGEFRLVTEWDRYGYLVSGLGYEINGNKYILVGDVLQEFGPFTLWLNARYVFGSLEYPNYPSGDEAAARPGRHMRQLSYAGTVEYKQGPIQAGVGYYFLPGQERNDDETIDADADITAARDAGEWFMPLYAAFGEYDGLLYNYNPDSGLKEGLRLFMAWFDYQLTEAIWLHLGAGYMLRDIEIADISRYYGTEFDFGVAIALAQGLGLEFHFGYFAPGDNIKDAYIYMYGGDPEIGPHIHADIMMVLKY